MLTYIKAAKVTKLCMDKLYVASSYYGLRFCQLLWFTGVGVEYDPKQQATAKFIDIMSMY